MYTKRPNFNNFGRFFVSKNKKIRVHTGQRIFPVGNTVC